MGIGRELVSPDTETRRPPPLWTPSRERVHATGLARFTASLSAQGHDVGNDYEALWRWSIENQSALWDAVWDWCGVVGDKGGRVGGTPTA